MKHFRNTSLCRFFSIVLAVLIFNISIDPPDYLINLDNDIELEEDLSQNEIESVAELILENGLGFDDAVPESDDPDSDSLFNKYEEFKGVCASFSVIKFYKVHSAIIYPTFEIYVTQTASFQILTPPPEA